VKFFEVVEKYASYSLLFLMAVIVIFATIEVGYEIVTHLFSPPGFFLGVADLLDLFGLFLMVLIGLELMTAIRVFLKDHNIHAELMLLVAITAITRKIVILDATKIDPMLMFAVGFVILALSGGYYLIRRSRAASD